MTLHSEMISGDDYPPFFKQNRVCFSYLPKETFIERVKLPFHQETNLSPFFSHLAHFTFRSSTCLCCSLPCLSSYLILPGSDADLELNRLGFGGLPKSHGLYLCSKR